jgi:hypothetical protein
MSEPMTFVRSAPRRDRRFVDYMRRNARSTLVAPLRIGEHDRINEEEPVLRAAEVN